MHYICVCFEKKNDFVQNLAKTIPIDVAHSKACNTGFFHQNFFFRIYVT